MADGRRKRDGEAASTAETRRAGGQQPGAPLERDAVDRDSMGRSDPGGSSDAEPAAQQGGAMTDDAAGGGRRPTAERDRDYDPDGDRTGV